MEIKDKIVILGMGCSKFGERWDASISDLIIESTTEALDDAKVDVSQIEAIYYGNGFENNIAATAVADTLKVEGIPIVRNENYCTSGHIALIEAIQDVASGRHKIVMALGAEKLKDTGYPGLGVGRGQSPVLEARRTAPGSFALIGTRYFHEFGLSHQEGRETIGKIAVKNHKNGTLSKKAHFQKEVTLEQVLNAPIIADPLGLYDCAGNSDGSACAIITTEEIAKTIKDKFAYVKGYGVAMDAVSPLYRPNFSWTSFNALRSSSQQAYDMAGIKNPRNEIDLAEVHDCFTITEMLIYEDFGFSDRGRAKVDIDNGFFEIDGGLPVNVDGGLKSFGHPVGASGIRMTYEIYKQVLHEVDNPKRQVKNANIGLSHTFGGPPQISAALILGNEKG
ncbi:MULTISPECIES: acetyl-CoA acetyltransferase [unclassified Jeotgalibaca]|uniref:acetyl-CoA acetyltransferase n=1 Tax=unclassified Jeotgalibaca TaxID=2621505 RepID=UPI003FD2C633